MVKRRSGICRHSSNTFCNCSFSTAAAIILITSSITCSRPASSSGQCSKFWTNVSAKFLSCISHMTNWMWHTHPFNGPFSGTTRKVKPIWILLKRETVSGRGISRAICKSAPHSRQTTTPAPHHSVFTGHMPFLPPNQQCQTTEG